MVGWVYMIYGSRRENKRKWMEHNSLPLQLTRANRSSVPVDGKGPMKESPNDCCNSVNDQTHFSRSDVVRRRQQDVVAHDAIRSPGSRVDADIERGLHACKGLSANNGRIIEEKEKGEESREKKSYRAHGSPWPPPGTD